MKSLFKVKEIPSLATYKLDAIQKAVSHVNHPERGRKTIIVAGTNGKGSVVHYLTELFLRAHWKVGTYISPHVIERRERIRVGGKKVSERSLRTFEKKYATVLEPLSYFERMTLLAFLIFRQRACDLQILEVGMGGELDATNISEPDYSVITRIDYDHQDILGGSLSEIASAKAGVMRPHKKVFIGPQREEAMNTLAYRARQKNAKLIQRRKPFDPRAEVTLKWIRHNRGLHQEQNARLALSVFEDAMRAWHFSLPGADTEKALKSDLPLARLQVLQKNPLHLVDGSHNLNSLEALRDFLKQKAKNKKCEIIFGVMNDKDRKGMMRVLGPWVRRIHFPVFYEERQVAPALLQQEWTEAGFCVGTVNQSLPSLLRKISAPALRRTPLICVGSLYLAGAFLRAYKKVKG